MENTCYYHISLKISKNVFLSSLSLNVVICTIMFLDKSKLHSKNSSIFYFSVLTPIFQSFTVQFWFLFFNMFLVLLGICYFVILILEAGFERFGWLASCSAIISPRNVLWSFFICHFSQNVNFGISKVPFPH